MLRCTILVQRHKKRVVGSWNLTEDTMKASPNEKTDQQASQQPAVDQSSVAIDTSRELGEKITESLIKSEGTDLALW